MPDFLNFRSIIIFIASAIITGGIWWGLAMLLPSTPHNGISIIVISVVVGVILFILAYIQTKRPRQSKLPRGGRGKMVFIFGIIFIVAGLLMEITQLDFHITTTEETAPQLQVTPTDIRDDNMAVTTMTIYVLNDSDYVAKHISVDIQFGDSLWKKELWKAASISVHDRLLAGRDDPLMAEILSKTSEQELKEMLRNYLDHPSLEELKPRVRNKLYIMDVNKDWVLRQETFWASGGKLTPIKPEESSDYQESQGWKEQIENTESGEPIKISLRTVWENEIGRVFDQTDEYQLICTKIGTGRSYTFLPIGKATADR